MGRDSTGAWTTSECLRIELSYLLKDGYLIRGANTSGSLHWNYNGQPSGNIDIVCHWPNDSAECPYIRLIYTTTDRTTGAKEDYDETIYLEARPSNLGRGEVLYFICPSSGQRCRILYKGYNCPIWKSRQSYKNRIYYPCQQSSKMDYANDRYWELERRIEKLSQKRIVNFYRDKPTRRGKLLLQLQAKQDMYDDLRFSPSAYPLSLRRSLFDELMSF